MTNKVTLAALANLQNETTAVNAINANSVAITTAMNNTLSRDGTSPNQMGATLDMNSNQIINLPQPATANSPLRFQDLDDFVGGGTVTNIPAGGAIHNILEKTSATDYLVNWTDSITMNTVGLTGTTGNQSSGDQFYNSVQVTDDKLKLGHAQNTFGLLSGLFVKSTGDSLATNYGQKYGFRGVVSLADTSVPLGTNGDLVGVSGWAISNVPNGGTNTGAGAGGTLYASEFVAHAYPGALNYFVVSGGETTAQIDAGASAAHRWGLSLAGNGVGRGNLSDAALTILTATSGGNYQTGLLLFNGGTAPLPSTATLIGTYGTSFPITHGLDLSGISVSGYFLKGPSNNFLVDGLGNITTNTTGGHLFSSTSSTPLQIQTTGADCVVVLNSSTTTDAALTAYADTTGSNVKWYIGKNRGATFPFVIYDNHPSFNSAVISILPNSGVVDVFNVVNVNTGYRINGVASSAHYLRGNGTNYIDSALLSADLSGTIPAANFPALTGDITTPGGSLTTTLATVASAGTTGSSTAIPVITINAKGLTTSITTAAVVAPAGTLTGATLAAGVTASSLTSLGTITTLTATTINAHTLGGTISGGGNQINNVVIGASTPLAGTFTTLIASTSTKTPIIFPASDGAAAVQITKADGSTSVISVNTTSSLVTFAGSLSCNSVTGTGSFGCGTAATGTAYLSIHASLSGTANLNLASGATVTSPNDGDIWYDGTNLKMRVGAATKTFTLV